MFSFYLFKYNHFIILSYYLQSSPFSRSHSISSNPIISSFPLSCEIKFLINLYYVNGQWFPYRSTQRYNRFYSSLWLIHMCRSVLWVIICLIYMFKSHPLRYVSIHFMFKIYTHVCRSCLWWIWGRREVRLRFSCF